MNEKDRELLAEFKSRFLEGDHVQSMQRETLASDDQNKSLEMVYKIIGVSRNYMASTSNTDEYIIVLKCMWGNYDLWHLSLKEFLGRRKSTYNYNFRRVDISKILRE